MKKVAVVGLVGNSAFLSVDRFHVGGETVAAKGIHFEPGGKGFNQALAAARFGAEVSFLGAVGNEYQKEIRQFLLNDGIEPCLAFKNEPTAFASILTDSAGQNQVTVFQGPRLSVDDVDGFGEKIAAADVLLLNNEVPLQVNERAIEIAKRSNTLIVYNPAPSIDLSPVILENVDYFTPNEHETKGLEAVDHLVVTLGAKGCLIKKSGKLLPALKLKNVVDTTGAGDTFNGIFAACLSEGSSLENAVEWAIRGSGVSVTRPYAATSIPTAEEIRLFHK